MPDIVQPSSNRPMVDVSGAPNQEMRNWLRLVTALDLIVGTGSPEGVVSADQARFYMDDAGIAGAIVYIKRDAGIGGDDSLGWILV